MAIPYICHFFTRAKFLENKIYTEKRQFFALNRVWKRLLQREIEDGAHEIHNIM